MNKKESKNEREPHFPVKHQRLWEYWVDSQVQDNSKPLSLSTEFISENNSKLFNDVIYTASKSGSKEAYHQINSILSSVSIEQKVLDKSLVLATQNDNNEVAELLLDNGASPEAYDGKAFLEAAAHNNLRLMVQYTQKHPPLKNLNLKAMASAARHGQIDVVKHLVEEGSYAYSDNGKAYQEAFIHGHVDIVNFLEDQGLNVGYLNSSAIRKAAQNGSLLKFAQDNPVKFRADFVVIHKLASKPSREAIYKAFMDHKYKDKKRPLGIWTSYNGILIDLDFAAMGQHFRKRLERKYGSHNKP
jgi:hypothetical protein